MTSKHCSHHAKSIMLLTPICLATLVLGACAPVQPWQRGHLALDVMALDEDPMLASINQHIYESKEASSGSISPAGGGCGCN